MSFGIPLDEIHTMLDTLDRELKRLALTRSGEFKEFVPMGYVYDAVSVLHELRDYDAISYLGIAPSLAKTLLDFNASVRTATVVAALERARTFLKSEESDYRGASGEAGVDRDQAEQIEEVPLPAPPPVAVWTEQWVYVQPRSKAKQVIAELSDLLEEVLLLAGQSNLPEEHAALSKLDRQQLIALLETALAVLKAPMVEPGLLKKLRKLAVEVGQSAAKKQAELTLGELATAAAGLIAKLLGYL
ncbi:hypothetical protein [Mesorhizobium sp. 113-3-3]|uniref:hypothetical protein n=1 Tax=Mesorhizobium sp. 113-3-3 TaxID=2744516 RepID=UPI0019289CAB|nr:hypothetical protein [Mesorhizobium sp. 113-3-3]BCG76750.1 hypothetical protein MesoLj113b_02920 [Mesorhizobium sp. 113-3-3]